MLCLLKISYNVIKGSLIGSSRSSLEGVLVSQQWKVNGTHLMAIIYPRITLDIILHIWLMRCHFFGGCLNVHKCIKHLLKCFSIIATLPLHHFTIAMMHLNILDNDLVSYMIWIRHTNMFMFVIKIIHDPKCIILIYCQAYHPDDISQPHGCWK